MMAYRSGQRKRLILDSKQPFPEKAFDVVNDGALLRWNSNGSVSVADEEAFEKHVMTWYPGFLQIPSFVNLRRLFREYGFDWCVNEDGEIEFYHPNFVRGQRELLVNITTRRKSSRFSVRRVYSDEDCTKRYYRTRKRKRVENEENEPQASIKSKEKLAGRTDKQSFVKVKPNTKELMVMFAENEFSDEEYLRWLGKRQEDLDSDHESSYFTAPLAYNYPDNSVHTSSEEIPIGAPCGMCQCCVAHHKLRESEINRLTSTPTSTPLSVNKNLSNVRNYELEYKDYDSF